MTWLATATRRESTFMSNIKLKTPKVRENETCTTENKHVDPRDFGRLFRMLI